MHFTLQSRSPDESKEVSEGKARLSIRQADRQVFYNPRMNLNRDLAVLFAASYFPNERRFRLCDPMTGCGVRTARYMLESHNMGFAVAADTNLSAVEAAQRTMELNGLERDVSVCASDANLLLMQNLLGRFDLVDLDPFGSPAPFFESALRATIDGGVVAATATDMAPLTGARPKACFRKYGVTPFRTEFEKELAIRILASCLANVAGRLELGVDIAFAHASDHYVRIFSTVRKGKAAANESASLLGYLQYCPTCLRRVSTGSLESIQILCENCGSRVSLVGPIWLGPLWNFDVVQFMAERVPTLQSSRLSEVQTILSRISDELKTPAFYYRTDVLARRFRRKPPAINYVLDSLLQAGFQASRTHFEPNGFRTNAKAEELQALLRSRN